MFLLIMNEKYLLRNKEYFLQKKCNIKVLLGNSWLEKKLYRSILDIKEIPYKFAVMRIISKLN